ncbi:cobalamin-binding protein [Mechercharimyces sp. CAU 1602]|uniref:cobalamin-binding protein n=1 Tax=Mechercharimyces sp. CAU 1602 TaxID=2973933 RepID=UPI0021630CFE|nr:cobalamin-binding protein [Mechercharimyces sp. CAU 1602]MCS1351753.1 cobalamin-binding protein [Mechercharimyces sp. CAU 1602]
MKRIVSICPSNTEVLASLGLTDRLVGIDDYSDWPNSISHLPRCGPDLHIDIDKVQRLQPDLVLASLSVPGMERNIERLEKENINTLILNPKSISDILSDIRTVGQHCGQERKAEKVVSQITNQLSTLRAHIPQLTPPPRLYWEWWPKPVFTPGGGNWLSEVSKLVGAVNIFADQPEENVKSTWEEVADRNPDRALIVWTGVPIERVKKEPILQRPAWQNTPIAHPERVTILEEGWYCRPSYRLLTGIQYLAHLLYPNHILAPDPNHPLTSNIPVT